MSDAKTKLIQSLERKLLGRLSTDDISCVSEALTMALIDYDVTDRCTDIVVYDDINERLIKQYMACLYVDGKSEKTAYQYRRTCEKLSEAIGKPFPEVTVYDIRCYLACGKERGLSNRSAENLRANLSAFFQWMFKEDLIKKNPCLNVNPIKYEDVVRKPFSEIEIDKLRMACKSKKERAIVELLLSSGIRVSELTDLRIADINRNDRSVHVRCGKGGKGRVTYTTNVALRHLEEYWLARNDTGDMAFYNGHHEPLNPGGVRYILKQLGKRAKVGNVHPHRFRRTFATKMASRGMDIQGIKALLGHSSINTTMGYVYLDDSNVYASYQKHIS